MRIRGKLLNLLDPVISYRSPLPSFESSLLQGLLAYSIALIESVAQAENITHHCMVLFYSRTRRGKLVCQGSSCSTIFDDDVGNVTWRNDRRELRLGGTLYRGQFSLPYDSFLYHMAFDLAFDQSKVLVQLVQLVCSAKYAFCSSCFSKRSSLDSFRAFTVAVER